MQYTRIHRGWGRVGVVLTAVAATCLPVAAQTRTVPRVALNTPYWGERKEHFLPLDDRLTIAVLIDGENSLLPMEVIRGLRMVQKFDDRVALVVVFVGESAKARDLVDAAIEQRRLLKLGLQSKSEYTALVDDTGQWYAELGTPRLPHALLIGRDGTLLGREILLGPHTTEVARIERALDPSLPAATTQPSADAVVVALGEAVRATPLLAEATDKTRRSDRLQFAARVDAARIVERMAAIDADAALRALNGYWDDASNFTLAHRLAAAALQRFGPERCPEAQTFLDSRVLGYCSVSHWNLETSVSAANPSPDLRMSLAVNCTLEALWSGAAVGEFQQLVFLEPGSEIHVTNDKFETLNAGWGDYLVRSKVEVTMYEGTWPNERAFPPVTRKWIEAVTFLPRIEGTEEHFSRESLPPETIALRDALNEAYRTVRRKASASRVEKPVKRLAGAVAGAHAWLAATIQRAATPAAMIGRNFDGIEIASWVQGQAQSGAEGVGRWKAPAGRVLLLDFMFVDCPPCRAALPDLAKLHDSYGERGLVVLSAVTSWGSRGIFGLVEAQGVKHAVAVLSEAEESKFGVTAFPTYLLIDRRGKIRWAKVGQHPDRRTIEELLAETP